jgi:hypothetical protein
MSSQPGLDRLLVAWLEDEAAAPPAPEPLTRVLRAIGRSRPRPAVVASLGSHWIDAGPAADAGTRRVRQVLVVAAVMLLVGAVVGGAVLVGSRLLAPRTAPPADGLIDDLASVGGLARPMTRPVLAGLPDGRVLIMGTDTDSDEHPPSAELYDPATGSSGRVGPLVPVGFIESATALGDGRVLIIGGDGQAQIFDPDTKGFSVVGPMAIPRRDTSAALLGDGRVLVLGGGGLREAELFDPVTSTFSATGTLPAVPAEEAAIASLRDGRLFMPLPVQPDPSGAWAIQAELYDPRVGSFSSAGTIPEFEPHAALTLPDGRVLLLGSTGNPDVGRAFLWDPATGRFSPLAPPAGRVSRATVLDDGRILLMGFPQFPHSGTFCQLRTKDACRWAGIYDPATGITTPIELPAASQPTLLRLSDGRVLVVGGNTIDVNGVPSVTTVQIYY